MGTCSDDVSTSLNVDYRVVGCEASGKMTARRVHGWPTQLGEKGFFSRVKLVATVKCNKTFSLWSTSHEAFRFWTSNHGVARQLLWEKMLLTLEVGVRHVVA